MTLASAFVRAPARQPMPPKFFNHERLLRMLEERGMNGVVLKHRLNVFYTSGFGPASNSAHGEDDGNAFVILSKDQPDHPILLHTSNDAPYFATVPTWIEDRRTYHRPGYMFPGGDPRTVLERNIAGTAPEEYLDKVRASFVPTGLADAIRLACEDLGLQGPVGFDVPEFARSVGAKVPGITPLDCRGPMKWVRSIKTPVEIELLRRATRINEEALKATVAAWEPGATLQDMYHRYDLEALSRGGFVRDPGASVIGNPRDPSLAFYNQSHLENYELQPGMHVMWDCHGTLDHYCWDGGKTWVVGGEPTRDALRLANAASTAMEEIACVSRPGVMLSEVTDACRRALAVAGCTAWEADASMIAFHGLGLDHLEMDMTDAPMDWAFEENMVIAAHIQVPGDERTRSYLEEIVVVRPSGGEKLFEWDWSLM